MSPSPVIVSLPIADRRTSFTFYCAGLGLNAVGELADDGVPEPLRIALNDGVDVMLIPTDGFGWIIGGNDVAARGHSECVVTLGAGTEAKVDEFIARAQQAGAQIITKPGQQPWGYAGAFADPDGHVWMVTSASLPPFGRREPR